MFKGKRIIMDLLFLFILSLFLNFQAPVSAQMHTSADKNYDYLQEQDSTATEGWWISVGVEVDTSEWFRTGGSITIFYWTCDTLSGTANDSVGGTLSYQSGTGKINPSTENPHIVVTKSSTHTVANTDSASNYWHITDTETPSGYWGRVFYSGSTDNAGQLPGQAGGSSQIRFQVDTGIY